MHPEALIPVEFTHFHLFCGSGGGALGFNRGHARHGRMVASMRCIGGVDVDPFAIRDFTRLVGVPGTVLDLFDEQQYIDFHGKPPPPTWRAALATQILLAAGGEFPDIVFLSAPCKGFSGLLNPKAAGGAKYQALNRLTVRGIRLMLEAFADHPPKLIIFENVPRIAQRGQALLEDIRHELDMAGYAIAESAHDCGEIGDIPQHRNRYLLVARHKELVPPRLYQPERHKVMAVGEVIGQMPFPDAPNAGPMHRLPRCTLETFIRLALIQPGKDARSLHGLDLNRYAIAPLAFDGSASLGPVRTNTEREWGSDELGVQPWATPAASIRGRSSPGNGIFALGDIHPPPNLGEHAKMRVEDYERPTHTITGVNSRVGSGALSLGDIRPMSGWGGKGSYHITPVDEPAHAVIAASSTGAGAFAMGDILPEKGRFNNVYRIIRYDEPASSVTGGMGPSSGGQSLGDIRPQSTGYSVYGVQRYDQPASAVTACSEPGAGVFSLGDEPPLQNIRLGIKSNGDAFASSGHYGVLDWCEASRAITGSGQHDNGYNSLGDIRDLRSMLRVQMDPPPVIISLWDTWNRPFTALECAAIQGYPWELLMVAPLDGSSETRWREHIGNSVPPPAAQAIASVMAHTLLLALAGVSFQLRSDTVWVQPRTWSQRTMAALATAVSVAA